MHRKEGTRIPSLKNQRDGEYTVSSGPIFKDFVNFLTEGSMQDNTGARLQTTLSPLYYLRVSLKTVKIFLAQH
jgi:hypothetical protein